MFPSEEKYCNASFEKTIKPNQFKLQQDDKYLIELPLNFHFRYNNSLMIKQLCKSKYYNYE